MRRKSRISGMSSMLISFVPWIIYWITAGMKVQWGIPLSLIISFFLLVFNLVSKSPSFMDTASTIYFIIATFSTFAFKANLFVEKSGMMGYMVLFIMAVISVLLKNPFTYQVSKKDYPKVYWKDPTFLLINNIISSFWAAVFLANSIVYTVIDGILALSISKGLIVVGMTFSIIFPMKAPAYFLTRRFKKHDWYVEVKGTRSDDEYDVIVVGSGIGGLSCGALLAKSGYRVLVLEKHHRVGGYCTSFTRKGFTFNAGVADVSGLWDKGPVRYLMEDLDLNWRDYFVKNSAMYIVGGQKLFATGSFSEFVSKLQELFPHEAENIGKFFDHASKAYSELYQENEYYGAPLPAELIVKVMGPEALSDFPRKHPYFYSWMSKTFKEVLDEYFNDENLKKFMAALLGYIGTSPEETTASSALTAAISYYMHGGYFPKGGAQHFANTLKACIEKHGGVVSVKHKVDEILIESGKVKGVQVRDKIFESSIVVANVNAKTLFLELIPGKHLEPGFLNYIRELKMSPSGLLVSLGVDMDLSSYPTLIHNLDEEYEVVIASNAEPNMAPPDMASISIITSANYYDFPDRGTKEYLEKKEKLADQLIEKVEKLIPGLKEHAVVRDVATPKTFEYYTDMPEGALYSFDQSIKTKRPYFKTPIKGLYLASASTFPGGGVEAVVISGRVCASDITGWRKRGRSK